MSKNGRGKLLQAVRNGFKPALDVRNRLIIPTLKIARELKPRLIVLENTLIMSEDGKLMPIFELIRTELGIEYDGEARVVEFADYGVSLLRFCGQQKLGNSPNQLNKAGTKKRTDDEQFKRDASPQPQPALGHRHRHRGLRSRRLVRLRAGC